MKYSVSLCRLTAAYLFCLVPRLTTRKSMRAFSGTLFAHRGYHCAKKGIPENSIPAFEAAVSLGYGIELDVHLTRDGQLVVFHDDTLDRLCGVPGTPESMTWKELSSLSLSGTSHRIPLLSQILELVDGRVPLLIELKIPSSSLEICRVCLPLLKSYHGPFLVQSFQTMGLLWFRLHAPHILRGQLSCRFNSAKDKESPVLRFLVRHLLCNLLGRPDFVSYKMAHLPSLSVTIIRKLFRLPVAVWTLRTPEALLCGCRHYDMQIFEVPEEDYRFPMDIPSGRGKDFSELSDRIHEKI